MHAPGFARPAYLSFAAEQACVSLIDIVNEGICLCLPASRGLWRLTAHNRQIMHNISLSIDDHPSDFLPRSDIYSRWALLMRAIKRLKGIWWMPWH